ncbi:MAG: hypothetical protein EOO27_13040 [Comamonadaceae bacterium]|nr:MAG: hypothetical protein EOO27_13040 [Comamonadaceae bacterium]
MTSAGSLRASGCYPRDIATNYSMALTLAPDGKRPPIGDLNSNDVSGTAGDEADVLSAMGWDAADMAISSHHPEPAAQCSAGQPGPSVPSAISLSRPLQANVDDAVVSQQCEQRATTSPLPGVVSERHKAKNTPAPIPNPHQAIARLTRPYQTFAKGLTHVLECDSWASTP